MCDAILYTENPAGFRAAKPEQALWAPCAVEGQALPAPTALDPAQRQALPDSRPRITRETPPSRTNPSGKCSTARARAPKWLGGGAAL